MCIFPIFINFSVGVNSISKNIEELLYVYNAGRVFRIFKIIIPLSTPYIFSGLKVSTTMAIMGAVVAEFVGAKDGLGKNLYLAPKNSMPELMVCSIVLIAFLGWFMFKLVVLAEKKLGGWYFRYDNKV
jgi:NitT/TauT family transport system permease protein